MSTSGGGFNANPTGPAGGDLSGAYPNPGVARLQGQPVSNTAPGLNQGLVWNGALWLPSALVNSFNARTGLVVPVAGDYTAAQVTNAADKSAAGTQTFSATVAAPKVTVTPAAGAAYLLATAGGNTGGLVVGTNGSTYVVQPNGTNGGNLLDDGSGAANPRGPLTVGDGSVSADIIRNGTGGGQGTSWTAYTPAIAGTGWALGNGSISGRYRMLDSKTMAIWIVMVFGSTTTPGAGALTLGLPGGESAQSTPDITALVFDGTNVFAGVGEGNLGTIEPLVATSTTNPVLGAMTSSHAWGATSLVRVTGVIEVA